jgi:hypothetical protein
MWAGEKSAKEGRQLLLSSMEVPDVAPHLTDIVIEWYDRRG